MTNPPPSTSSLPSGAAILEMQAASPYTHDRYSPSSLASMSRLPPTCLSAAPTTAATATAAAAAAAAAHTTAGPSSLLSPRHPPIDASVRASNQPPNFNLDLAFRNAAPHSPQPPLPSMSSPFPPTMPGQAPREPLPAFTFPPPALSPGSFPPPYNRGLSPENYYSMLRSPTSPGPFSMSHATPATRTRTETCTMDHLSSGLYPSAPVSGAFSVAGAATSQSSAHLIQRLTQQNIHIRDAWEAERTYLEANRRRAEEVYQEERAIMEDFREAWSNERLELLHTMQLLRERIQRLEGENSALKAMVAQSMPPVTGVLSPLASQRGDSVNGSTDHSLSGSPVPADVAASSAQHSSSQKHGYVPSVSAVSASLPPGLDGASRRPHFASPPRQHPSPPLAMDPRTQPEASVMHDFLGTSPGEAEAPVAVIDVHEIDPRLEGISLKATAIQKPTFFQKTAISPPVAHSPPMASSAPEEPTELNGSDQPEQDSTKGRTRQVLAAGASRRLTMHAGHTPIHSLSVFPTMTTATGASSLVARSGDTTPTGAAPSPPPEAREQHPEDEIRQVHAGDPDVVRDEASPPNFEPEKPESVLDDECLLQAQDDPPLKGPLMVKNIPAQDELFWAAVNKKLEPISQGQDALPTVMQAPVAELDMGQWPDVLAVVGGGGARRAPRATGKGNDDDDIDDDDDDDDPDSSGKKSRSEIDVPLKLRTTTNFGAPFGRM